MERLLHAGKKCGWCKGERMVQESHDEKIEIIGLHVRAAAAVLQRLSRRLNTTHNTHRLTSPQKFSECNFRHDVQGPPVKLGWAEAAKARPLKEVVRLKMTACLVIGRNVVCRFATDICIVVSD